MRRTLTDLLYEYDAKRNRSESIARARLTALMEAHPRLRELKSRHDEAYFSAMREAVLNPAKRAALMSDAKVKAEQIMQDMDSFCQKNGIDLALTQPAYDCTVCKDTGYITVNNAKALCSCIVNRMNIEVYGGCDIDSLEGSFDRYDLSVFKEAGQRTRAEKLEKFAHSFLKGERKLYALFEGKSGLGKSFLMHCMAKELKNRGKNVLFIGAFNMFECFKLNRIGELGNIAPIMDAEYLFIDDLGSEPMTQNVTREYLFNMIENRTAKELCNVISTNLQETELKERYGEKVMSRLLSDRNADVIEFVGEDIRLGRIS